MKTEHFDENIRKKLEAMQADVTENDWNKFAKKNKFISQPEKRIIPLNIMKIAASFAAACLVFISTAQFVNNSNLKTKITLIEEQKKNLETEKRQFQKQIEEIKEELEQQIAFNQELLKNIDELKKIESSENIKKKRAIKVAIQPAPEPVTIETPKDTVIVAKKTFFQKVSGAISGLFKGKKAKNKKSDSLAVDNAIAKANESDSSLAKKAILNPPLGSQVKSDTAIKNI